MTDWIEDIAALEALYGTPGEASLVKVTDRLTPEYRAWIEAAPFCALATLGPEGLDCSPRGDDGPVVQVVDARTLALPDRRGNNRIDSLRNIVRDPKVSLMFLIPGSGTVIRVNGTARVTADAAWLDRCKIHDKPPRSVIVITIDEIYFQCARAVLRGKLWSGGIADPDTLPSVGQILEAMSQAKIDGESYDADWPGRAAQTMW
ncbi:MAG: pyridoxamine 5'-phosphate oxidase family protein [Pseudomonadota bacterium]